MIHGRPGLPCSSSRFFALSIEAFFQTGRVGDDNSKIYFMTNLQAKNYKVAIFDVQHADAGLTTLVAEDPGALLTAASIHAGNHLVLIYLHDAKHEIHVHDLATGQLLRRILEELVGTLMVTGRREDNDMFIHYSGFISPGTVYRRVFHNCSRHFELIDIEQL